MSPFLDDNGNDNVVDLLLPVFFLPISAWRGLQKYKKACPPLTLECKSSRLESQHYWKILRDFTL